MKRKIGLWVLGLVIVLGLAACSQGSDDGDGSGSADGGQSVDSSANEGAQVASNAAEVETIIATISDDFDGALSPMGQLALGTLRLDDGELAVSEAQAAELLPLWQALQSLSNSQTTAEVELDAVVKQIQGTMSAEQVAAIAGMQLTEASLSQMMESGELGFGQGLRGFGGRGAGGDGDGGFPLPPGGAAGAGPGGLSRPGGGQGGGPGGLGGGRGGDLSEDDIATRRAEFAESGLGDLGERFLAGAVVRLMQNKSGEAPADRGGVFTTVFEVIAAETGLSVEDIQEALAGEQTLTDIIESQGGDVAAVRAALVEALQGLPDAENFDAEEMADQWLGQ